MTYSLTIDQSSGEIYSTELSDGHLISINSATGAGTTHGAIAPYIRHLAYNASNSTIYANDNNSIFTIDAITGNSTYIADSTAVTAINGFTVDPSTGNFYSADTSSPNQNLTVFDATGTRLGLLAFNITDSTNIAVSGLEWNSNAGTLFGIDRNTKKLFVVSNLESAAGNFLNTMVLGNGAYRSLAFSADNNVLFTIENEARLQAINALTGVATQIINLNGDLPGLYGLTFQP